VNDETIDERLDALRAEIAEGDCVACHGWNCAAEALAIAEQLRAKLAAADAEWKPGRWYRIHQPDGTLWMETSDRREAQADADETGWPLERLYVSTRNEWRRVRDDAPGTAHSGPVAASGAQGEASGRTGVREPAAGQTEAGENRA
jgi:hypothetical protein